MEQSRDFAVRNSLSSWGRAPVIATRIVVADAAELHALISDRASQWRLVAGLSSRLRARAVVDPSHDPEFVHARVRFGRRDVLWITWMLTPLGGTTEVDLAAQVDGRSVLSRLVLALGGRRRLRRHLDETLAVLAALAVRAAEDLDDVEGEAVFARGAAAAQAGLDGIGPAPTHGAV